MSAFVLCALGAVLVALVVLDIIVTVLGVSGGDAVISRIASRGLWMLGARVHKWRPSHGLLRMVGPASFVLTAVSWAVILVVGWMLVFWPDPALMPDGAPHITISDRLDHAASLILGGSSKTAQIASQPWSLIARLANFSGLSLASFGLAYALPVVGAVVSMRATARTISSLDGLHGSLQETATADGGDSVLHLHLINLTSSLTLLSQQIHAYPLVQFFHSKERRATLSVQIHDLQTFLEDKTSTDMIPESVMHPLQSAVDGLIVIVGAFFCGQELVDEPPPDGRMSTIERWVRLDGWSDSVE